MYYLENGVDEGGSQTGNVDDDKGTGSEQSM
jgi:hypothetical protein